MKLVTLIKNPMALVTNEETTVAWDILVDKIITSNGKGYNSLVVETTYVEGHNFNLRGRLSQEGFILINRPNKRIYIMW